MSQSVLIFTIIFALFFFFSSVVIHASVVCLNFVFLFHDFKAMCINGAFHSYAQNNKQIVQQSYTCLNVVFQKVTKVILERFWSH